VTDVVGVVEVPEDVDDFFVSVIPCSVMQLRNVANAVELAPDFPANPPPPPKEPAGRRLAQSLNAAPALEFAPPAPPPPNPPAGGVPPPAPPPGRPPVGAVTPCDLRQLVNAVLDAEDEDFVVVVVDFFVDDGEELPHAASKRPATAMPTSVTETVRNFVRLTLASRVLPMATSMESESGRSLMAT
jgi:hypothetical protein